MSDWPDSTHTPSPGLVLAVGYTFLPRDIWAGSSIGALRTGHSGHPGGGGQPGNRMKRPVIPDLEVS